MRIICIDDEALILKDMLEFVLDKDIDCRFFCKETEKAVEYSAKNKVDLAFIDICLGKENGFCVARKLLCHNSDIKIVFITGFSYDEEETRKELGKNVLAILKKPLSGTDVRYWINFVASDCTAVEITTFGAFGVKVNGEPVRFISAKSKELLAFLIYNNGNTVEMENVICALWADKDLDKAKIMYRDSVWKLRKTLTNYHIPWLVEFGRKSLTAKKDGVVCDYWDLLDGKNNDYRGNFLTNYDWSFDEQRFLDEKYDK